MSALTTTLKDITHKFVITNDVKLHYVEMGAGPTVLLVHGFPDFWYGFRYQIPALAAAGFHVVVPDLRGYGDSDIPESVEKYTLLDIVGDLVGLIESLEVKQVLLVGHDWGTQFVWEVARMRPDLVRGLVSLGSALITRSSRYGELPERACRVFGDKTYLYVFQDPSKAEALLGKEKTAYLLKAFFTRWFTEDPKFGIPKVYSDEEEAKRPLPEWLTEKDLEFYAQTFDKTGFRGALNYYPNFKRSWELWSPFASKIVEPHALVIDAELGLSMSALFSEDELVKPAEDNYAIALNFKGRFTVPASHFMHQEQHERVNKLILDFFLGLKDE